MNQPDEPDYQIDTLAIRTGHTRSFEGEHGEPIFLTSSFVYANAEEAAAKFSGQIPVISTRASLTRQFLCLKNVLLH